MTCVAEFCRLSGEPLVDAELLFEVADCPLPGVYPASATEALSLRSPLRVVQARRSRFVQLADVFEGTLYQQYSFAGGVSETYRSYLESFAAEIIGTFPKSTSILEVGCGDGWLLRRLREFGFNNVLGIDPGRAVCLHPESYLISGYFPQAIPAEHQGRKFDLIICRHTLEHIETPRPFLAALVSFLASQGELWLEVPDLDSTVSRELWSNFYQLHCNYFSDITLDTMAAGGGLRCVSGTIVEVFGGSLLRKYVRDNPPELVLPPRLAGLAAQMDAFRSRILKLVSHLPPGAAGYGAAERTAMTLGLVPELLKALACLYDGNPLLTDRYIAGTELQIFSREKLFERPPPAILIFAISNFREILAQWRGKLPGKLLVGLVGGDFSLKPLQEFA